MSVTTEIRGDVAVIWIDNPPINATSQAVRAGILENVTAAVENARVGAIVIATRGRTFIAGGDVREFGPPPVPPHLPDVVNAIEQSPKPEIGRAHV